MVDRLRNSRRARRLPLPVPVRSEINRTLEAAVLDLTEWGARIEHRAALHPGQMYLLQIHLPSTTRAVCLSACAIWSWGHRIEPGPESGVLFHSGMEFQGLTPEGRRPIAAFLSQFEGQESDSPPAAGQDGKEPLSIDP